MNTVKLVGLVWLTMHTIVATGCAGGQSGSSEPPVPVVYKQVRVDALDADLPDGYNIEQRAMDAVLREFSTRAIVRSGSVEPEGYVNGENVPEQRLLCEAGEFYLPQDTPASIKIDWTGEPLGIDLLALEGEPKPSLMDIYVPVTISVGIEDVYAARETTELVVNQTNDDTRISIAFRAFGSGAESPGLLVNCTEDGMVQDAVCRGDIHYEEPQVRLDGRLTQAANESWMRVRVVRELVDDPDADPLPKWLVEMPQLLEQGTAVQCETDAGVITSDVRAEDVE